MKKKELKVGYLKTPNSLRLTNLNQIDDYDVGEAISFDYCGDEKCEKGHKFGPFIRRNYVIHIVLSGYGEYIVAEKKYRIGAGQAFLIKPGIATTYYADMEEPWHYCWIGFHGYKSEELIYNMGFFRNNHVIEVNNPNIIAKSISRIFKFSTLNVTDELRRKSRLLETLALLIENNDGCNSTNNKTYKSSKYVNMAIEYLRTHYSEKIEIGELAHRIGITRSYLTHIFKNQIGISPQEFLINIRLTTSSGLLKKSDKPICEIAILCGYEDPLAFSKAFKRKFGISPREYRDYAVKTVTKSIK